MGRPGITQDPRVDDVIVGEANSSPHRCLRLVGGHPDRYRDVLAKRFPAIPVFIMPQPMQANVRGFQMIGEAELEA